MQITGGSRRGIAWAVAAACAVLLAWPASSQAFGFSCLFPIPADDTPSGGLDPCTGSVNDTADPGPPPGSMQTDIFDAFVPPNGLLFTDSFHPAPNYGSGMTVMQQPSVFNAPPMMGEVVEPGKVIYRMSFLVNNPMNSSNPGNETPSVTYTINFDLPERLHISPATLTFPNQQTGTTAGQQYTISNLSPSTPVTVTNIGLGGTGAGALSESGCLNVVLAPNGTCVATLHFDPMTVGAFPATLTVTGNDTSQAQISGTSNGVAPGGGTGGACPPNPTVTAPASVDLTLQPGQGVLGRYDWGTKLAVSATGGHPPYKITATTSGTTFPQVAHAYVNAAGTTIQVLTTRQDPPPGPFTVTVVATDSKGCTGQATVQANILTTPPVKVTGSVPVNPAGTGTVPVVCTAGPECDLAVTILTATGCPPNPVVTVPATVEEEKHGTFNGQPDWGVVVPLQITGGHPGYKVIIKGHAATLIGNGSSIGIDDGPYKPSPYKLTVSAVDSEGCTGSATVEVGVAPGSADHGFLDPWAPLGARDQALAVAARTQRPVRSVKLGSGAGKIAAGKRGSIAIRLNHSGIAQLARHHSLKVILSFVERRGSARYAFVLPATLKLK